MNKQKIENKLKKEKKESFFKKLSRKRKIILIILLIVITIISLVLILNFSFDLYTYDSPLIRITPEKLMLTLKNNEVEEVEFNISTQTSFTCISECEFSLIDRENENSITKGNFSLGNNKIATIKTNLESPEIGVGKKIYNFEVSCKNKKSFFCKQTSEESINTAFIILSHELTDKEKEIKEDYRSVLLEYIDDINYLNNEFKEIYYYFYEINDSLIENLDINLEIISLNISINDLISSLNNSLLIWENERYNDLLDFDKVEFNNAINESKRKILEINNSLNQLIEIQNKLTNEFNELIIDIIDLFEMREYLNLNHEVGDLINEFNYLLNKTILIYNNKYDKLNDFENNLKNLTLDYISFESNYTNYIDDINSKKVSVLSVYEENRRHINQKVYFNLSTILDSEYCEVLSGLLVNNSNFNYNLKEGKIYFYNNSFFNYLGSEIECNSTIESCPYNLSEDKFVILNDSLYNLNSGNISINDKIQLNDSYELNCKLKENNLLENFENFILFNSSLLNFSKKLILNERKIFNNTIFKRQLIEPTEQCCLFNQCSECCYDQECRDAIASYPLLVIHGHSVLKSTPADAQINSFNNIILNLLEDGYIDAGQIDYEELYSKDDLEWSYFSSPMVAKASYYYDSYFSLGSYVYITRKNDNIDTYAIRLSNIINTYKRKTGKSKIDLIAHSMGGLVVRRYLQIFGTDSVNKVILIATPNYGVEDRISFFCPVFGGSLECEDMQEDSIFLSKLNDPNYNLGINITTIVGSGCLMKNDKNGDGVVTLESSILNYSKSYIVNGTCNDFLQTSLHSDLLDITKYPEVYDIIKDELNID